MQSMHALTFLPPIDWQGRRSTALHVAWPLLCGEHAGDGGRVCSSGLHMCVRACMSRRSRAYMSSRVLIGWIGGEHVRL